MNNKVIATIDVSRPAGRKIVRELQKKRTVTLEYPTPPEFEDQKWYTAEEVFTEVEKKLNDHYGSNLKLKY
jgi:hypothetical protein